MGLRLGDDDFAFPSAALGELARVSVGRADLLKIMKAGA
jgi:hypothetical protein